MPQSLIVVMRFSFAFVLLAGSVQWAAAQGTAFTYQGRLTDNGAFVSGAYDLRFRLYDAVTSGALVSGTLTIEDVPVSIGLFNVAIDFGSGRFNGADRWLEIQVRPGSSLGSFILLNPRQQVLPAPYAIYSGSANNSNQLDGLDSLNFLRTTPPATLAGNITTTNALNVMNSTNGSTAAIFALHSNSLGTGAALHAETNSHDLLASAILGHASSTATGVTGSSVSGVGVLATSQSNSALKIETPQTSNATAAAVITNAGHGSSLVISQSQSSNTSSALSISNAGGYGLSIAATGPTARGINLTTSEGTGQAALTISNGALVLKPQDGYISADKIDNGIIRLTTPGSYFLPTTDVANGTLVWLVNTTGGFLQIGNVMNGPYPIGNNYAQQFLFHSTVSTSDWIAVQ